MSLDGDKGSKVRNKIAPVLRQNSLDQPGSRTGSWRGIVAEHELDLILQELAKLSDVPTNFPNANHAAKLDHLWIYAEKYSKSKKKPTKPE